MVPPAPRRPHLPPPPLRRSESRLTPRHCRKLTLATLRPAPGEIQFPSPFVGSESGLAARFDPRVVRFHQRAAWPPRSIEGVSGMPLRMRVHEREPIGAGPAAVQEVARTERLAKGVAEAQALREAVRAASPGASAKVVCHPQGPHANTRHVNRPPNPRPLSELRRCLATAFRSRVTVCPQERFH